MEMVWGAAHSRCGWARRKTSKQVVRKSTVIVCLRKDDKAWSDWAPSVGTVVCGLPYTLTPGRSRRQVALGIRRIRVISRMGGWCFALAIDWGGQTQGRPLIPLDSAGGFFVLFRDDPAWGRCVFKGRDAAAKAGDGRCLFPRNLPMGASLFSSCRLRTQRAQ